MLSFIRKRLPSRDRSNEHLQNIKAHQHQNDHQMKTSQSANELNVNNNEKKKKKKNKKERSSLALDELVLNPNTSSIDNQINKSYSDVDYFPMMPGALSQFNHHDKNSQNRDSLADSYLTASESAQITSDINYVQTQGIKVPVIDCRHDQRLHNYKGIDHQRTKALREVTEQRMQERSVK